MALAALACGSGPSDRPSWLPGGGGGPNRAACEAYVERVNALGSCVQVTYDPANLCEGAGDLPPEMASFYDCLRTHSRCDGDQATIGEGCTPPMIALGWAPTGPVDVTMDAGKDRGKEDR